jgi:hypothetical protein
MEIWRGVPVIVQSGTTKDDSGHFDIAITTVLAPTQGNPARGYLT